MAATLRAGLFTLKKKERERERSHDLFMSGLPDPVAALASRRTP